jgi:ribosomal-protein-alanine N-acetyltransferase
MTLPQDFTLESPHCRLRYPSREDIPHIFSATRHKGFNDGMKWDAPAREQELHESYERTVRAWTHGDGYSFTIETKEPVTFIGRIGIRREQEAAVWSIGFWTHPEQQGKGFMSEVVPAILDLGFRQLGAVRIEACYALWNHASRRVLEKSGMTFVQFVPQGFQKWGNWVEENLYAITREIWNNSH